MSTINRFKTNLGIIKHMENRKQYDLNSKHRFSSEPRFFNSFISLTFCKKFRFDCNSLICLLFKFFSLKLSVYIMILRSDDEYTDCNDVGLIRIKNFLL